MSAPVLRLRIKTDNAAFEDDARPLELARILRHVADQIEAQRAEDGDHCVIFDANGNGVGEWALR